jgi:WD40 repeat protein
LPSLQNTSIRSRRRAYSTTMWRFTACALLAMNCSFAAPVDPVPQQQWKLALRDVLRAPLPDWNSYSVWGLAFSPDGSRLAIGFGDSTKQTEVVRRVIVVPVSDPGRVERSFDFQMTLGPWVGPPCCASLSWSPDGRRLVVSNGLEREPKTLVFDLHSDFRCQIDTARAFFLSPSTSISSVGSVFTEECIKKEDWNWGTSVRVKDVSPEAGLIAASRDHPITSTNEHFWVEGLLYRVSDRSAPQTSTAFAAPFDPLTFAQAGNIICGTDGLLSCHPVDGSPPLKLPAGRASVKDVKAAGNRLVFTEYETHRIPTGLATFLDIGDTTSALKRRMIWDLKQGRMIAAYKPQVASVTIKGFGRRDRIFAYAISADGNYVAEGTPDSVILYRLP